MFPCNFFACCWCTDLEILEIINIFNKFHGKKAKGCNEAPGGSSGWMGGGGVQQVPEKGGKLLSAAARVPRELRLGTSESRLVLALKSALLAYAMCPFHFSLLQRNNKMKIIFKFIASVKTNCYPTDRLLIN